MNGMIPATGSGALGRHRRGRVFSQEDDTKPENRANLALYHCMSISTFRRRVLPLLGLPDEAILRPEMNFAVADTHARPDMIVRLGGEDGPELARIECENWGENNGQTETYGEGGEVQVILVLGPQSPLPRPRPNVKVVTWTDILASVREAREDTNTDPQQHSNLGVLVDAIKHVIGLAGRSRTTRITASQITHAWVLTAGGPLIRLAPHFGVLDNTHENSVSVKLRGLARVVRGQGGTRRPHLSMISYTSLMPREMKLALPSHLKTYLVPNLHAWVDEVWAPMVNTVAGAHPLMTPTHVRFGWERPEADAALVEAALRDLITRITGIE